jgi:hypothetical protein
MPDYELVARPFSVSTDAVTIGAPPDSVCRWIRWAITAPSGIKRRAEKAAGPAS